MSERQVISEEVEDRFENVELIRQRLERLPRDKKDRSQYVVRRDGVIVAHEYSDGSGTWLAEGDYVSMSSFFYGMVTVMKDAAERGGFINPNRVTAAGPDFVTGIDREE